MSSSNTLAIYNPQVDLVTVRSLPEKFPRIGKTDRAAAVSRLVPIVYGALLYNNQDVTKDRLLFMAEAIYEEIMADNTYGLRFLSWMEIGMVVRRAVIGGAREMYGVSVSTILSALIDYAKTEGHEANAKAIQRRNEGRQTEITAAVEAYAAQLAEKIENNANK